MQGTTYEDVLANRFGNAMCPSPHEGYAETMDITTTSHLETNAPSLLSSQPLPWGAAPSPERPTAQQQQQGKGPKSRLSPYLLHRTGSLLGRPRASSFAASPSQDAVAVRRQVFAPSTSDTKVFSSNAKSDDAVIPPPPTLPRIATVTAMDGAKTSSSASSISTADLVALSNLTLSAENELRSRHTTTSTISEGYGGALSSADTSPPPGKNSTPAVTIAAPSTVDEAPADWRTACRVPLLSPEGNVMGYRQNSSMLRRQMEVSMPSDWDAYATSPPESPLYFGNGSTAHNNAVEEFLDASQDPFSGFPDAQSRVPGYLLGPLIGRGGFSTVRKGLHLATSLPVAIKVIDKERIKDPKDRSRVDREMRVMRQLSGHVGIAQLYECFETPQYLYLIMEYCAGGSLLDYVRNNRKLPEHEACVLFQQLLAALQHCHRRGVVHRDIKLENVLLDGRGGLRLIDFGLCGYYVPNKTLRCHCGSPSYAAPEIVARRDYIAPPVDVWSAGVVLFAMLAGYLPFQAKDKKGLSQKILEASWKPAEWISPEAVDLLGRMLTLDPVERISMDQIWEHPFVASGPRWEGRGEGTGGLMRARVDPVTGAHVPDPEVVSAWATATGAEANVAGLLRSLRNRECNSLTAGYHLLSEAKAAARESESWSHLQQQQCQRRSDTTITTSDGSSDVSDTAAADLEVFI